MGLSPAQVAAAAARRLEVAQGALERLCSEEYAGRRVGTEGHDRAQRWLLDQLAASGYATRLLKFDAPDVQVLDLWAPPTLAVLNGGERHLTHRVEFVENPRSAPAAEPRSGMARASLGELSAGEWLAAPQVDDLESLAARLAPKDVLGILVPVRAGGTGFFAKRVSSAPVAALPIVAVRSDLLPALEGKVVRAQVPVRRIALQGANVIGMLAGTDPALAHAPLLVGAHYDGVGDDPELHRIPGAGDNAAGVAVVFQVAAALAGLHRRPRRPLLIAAFDAEEVGAIGSRVYAQELRAQGLEPLVINVDGAARFNDAVWVEASANADPIVSALDQAGRDLEIPLVLGPVASDNRRYAGAGFPAVGVALGVRGEHTPDDRLENVDANAMAVALRLLAAVIWQLAF
ncbi:MAG: Zn-dependent exopeptidase M28 [Chloroflexi bacterium]|nr:MAG: Zn-dependent exopeptidase M28 [Chloroflexota bacterium]